MLFIFSRHGYSTKTRKSI
jgi:hypothetical protein